MSTIVEMLSQRCHVSDLEKIKLCLSALHTLYILAMNNSYISLSNLYHLKAPVEYYPNMLFTPPHLIASVPILL